MTIIAIIVLVIMSAICSGMTIGMYAVSIQDLERQMKLGNLDAKRVLGLRMKGNFLHSTLLLSNSAINSSIPILAGNISTGVVAIIVSTILIFIFGEVIPQVSFAKYALPIGARTAWVADMLCFVMYPIAKPVSWCLDKIFGKEISQRYAVVCRLCAVGKLRIGAVSFSCLAWDLLTKI